MPRFLPDSSVIVAAVSSWHERREAAVAELDTRLDTGEEMVLAGPSVVESFSVLTRLPAPYRLSANDARALIMTNFVERAEVVALDATQYRSLLDRALALGVAGGQLYDLVIAECARQATVQALLTFNAQHFRRLADRSIEVVVPGGTAEQSGVQ